MTARILAALLLLVVSSVAFGAIADHAAALPWIAVLPAFVASTIVGMAGLYFLSSMPD